MAWKIGELFFKLDTDPQGFDPGFLVDLLFFKVLWLGASEKWELSNWRS